MVSITKKIHKFSFLIYKAKNKQSLPAEWYALCVTKGKSEENVWQKTTNPPIFLSIGSVNLIICVTTFIKKFIVFILRKKWKYLKTEFQDLKVIVS